MWVKVDDRFDDDPRVVAAGPTAAGLLVMSLAYVNRMLTDGFVPAGIVRRHAAEHLDDAQRTIDFMTKVGMWSPCELGGIQGFQIHHDYMVNQPTKAVVDDLRRQRAEAGRTGGVKSGEARRKRFRTKREAGASSSGSEAKNQTLTPDPDPGADPGIIVSIETDAPPLKGAKDLPQAVVDLWNRTMRPPFGQVQLLGDRRAVITERLRTFPERSDWERAFSNLQSDAFARGDNRTGFIVTFDWLTRCDEHLERWIERHEADRSESYRKAGRVRPTPGKYAALAALDSEDDDSAITAGGRPDASH